MELKNRGKDPKAEGAEAVSLFLEKGRARIRQKPTEDQSGSVFMAYCLKILG